MKLTIVSLKEKIEHAVSWIEINTPDGNFIIQPGYTPTTFIVSEKQEFIYCLKSGKLETIELETGGILSVERHTALLLLQ